MRTGGKGGLTTELHVKLGFARGDTVLCKSGTEVFHHQRRLCFILERIERYSVGGVHVKKKRDKGKEEGKGGSLPHPSRCDARLRRSRPATRRVRADPCVLVRICRDVRDELLRRERQEAFSVCQQISYISYISKKGEWGWSGTSRAEENNGRWTHNRKSSHSKPTLWR